MTLHLGLCQLHGADSWRRAIRGKGYDPRLLKVYTLSHVQPAEYVASFKTRPYTSNYYIVRVK